MRQKLLLYLARAPIKIISASFATKYLLQNDQVVSDLNQMSLTNLSVAKLCYAEIKYSDWLKEVV